MLKDPVHTPGCSLKTTHNDSWTHKDLKRYNTCPLPYDHQTFQSQTSHENKTASEVVNELNKKSGYLGMSGRSNDARDVTAGMEQGDHRCKLTFDVQAKRIVDYIASYYVYMGGCDAICFTAGMGENLVHLRKNILNRLGVLGVKLDEKANDVHGEEKEITTKDSKIKAYVIPTNEEVMIARDVVRVAHLA